MKKIFLIPFWLLLLTMSSSSSAYANKVVFSEDFSTNFDKWENPRNNFHLWSIISGKAQAQINSASTVTELVPKDSYWDSSWKNIKVELDFTPNLGADKNLSFNFVDLNNWYEIHFNNDGVELIKVENGIASFSESASKTLANGVSYHLTLVKKDTNLTFSVDDEIIFDIDMPEIASDSGKIGLKAGTGAAFPTKVLFDNIVVTDLDAVDLDVPYFSQNDPEWGSDEYDSASQYPWGSNPSVERWGCAMTSAAMILRYYEHDSLPDGTELTPGTLNEWLKDQPDGYYAGNTNWLALTRLSIENNAQDSSKTVLEFSRNTKDDDVLIDELKNDHPIILRVPEVNDFHFVVAKGISQNKFQILDPEWEDRTDLSEYSDSYQSMRIFTPSQTDLSYFMFATSPNVHLVLKDSNGNALPLETYSDEAIADPNNPTTKQPDQKYFLLPMPGTGNYSLEASAPTGTPYTLQSFIYDEEANVTPTKIEGYTGPTPQVFEIDFDKETGGDIEEEVNFSQFLKDIELMKELGHLKNQQSYLRLKSLAIMGQNATNVNLKIIFTNTIETVLKFMPSSSIDATGKTYLTEKIRAVRTALKTPPGS